MHVVYSYEEVLVTVSIKPFCHHATGVYSTSGRHQSEELSQNETIV